MVVSIVLSLISYVDDSYDFNGTGSYDLNDSYDLNGSYDLNVFAIRYLECHESVRNLVTSKLHQCLSLGNS